MFDILGKSIVAIDIGSSSVKIVEVGGFRKTAVKGFGLEVLPAHTVEDGTILDGRTLETTIRNLINKLKITTFGNNAGISVGGRTAIIKAVNLSKPQTDPDFYEYLYHEAEQHLQYDVSELYIDWVILPNIRGNKGSSVLLVGAKRDVVEEHRSIVHKVGLKVSIIDCDVLAAINIVARNVTEPMRDLVVIVDVGYLSTQVSLLIDGSFVFTREVSVGGNSYSVKMAELLGLDLDGAEALKITVSSGDRAAPEECENIINEINASFVSEINETISYYFRSGETNLDIMKPAKVCLLGGGSRTAGLDVALKDALQTSVEHIDPFRGVRVNRDVSAPQFIAKQGHLFGVAMGLAARKLDDKAAKKAA